MPSLKSNLLPAPLQSVPSLLWLLEFLSCISYNHPRFEPCPAISPHRARSRARSIKLSLQQQLSPHVSASDRADADPVSLPLKPQGSTAFGAPQWPGGEWAAPEANSSLVGSAKKKKKTCLKFSPTICKNCFCCLKSKWCNLTDYCCSVFCDTICCCCCCFSIVVIMWWHLLYSAEL